MGKESSSDDQSEADRQFPESSSTTSESTSEEDDLAPPMAKRERLPETVQVQASNNPSATPISFDDNVWKVVEEYTDKHHSPMDIRQKLLAMDLPVPTSFQIASYLVQYKSQKIAAAAISQSELCEVLKKFKSAPNPEATDTPFVIQDEDIKDFSVFRFFVTTRALMGKALKATHLRANATDTCTWRGCPMFIVGTTDLDRRFHLIGICVCANNTAADFEFLFRSVKLCGELLFQTDLNPEAVVCDTNAVQKGFRAVFGDDRTIVTCWNYMKRGLTSKLKTVVEDLGGMFKILEDLEFLQQIASRSLFPPALKLFVKKWSRESTFIKYFQSEWIDQNPNWFRGALPKGGNTNKDLEGADHCLRNNFGKHDRLSLSEFCSKLTYVIRTYSKQGKTKKFATETFIPERKMINAYNWSEDDCYFSPEESSNFWQEDSSSDSDSEDGVQIKLVKSSTYDESDCISTSGWYSLDDFKSFFTSIWEITRQKEGKWMDAVCTCPSFNEDNICKHVIGIAICHREVEVGHDLQVEARQARRRRRRNYW